MWCGTTLHDRKVMAPLKRSGVFVVTLDAPPLHDRKVMAPLKRGMGYLKALTEEYALHDRKVMAPLKRRQRHRHRQRHDLSMTARSWPH